MRVRPRRMKMRTYITLHREIVDIALNRTVGVSINIIMVGLTICNAMQYVPMAEIAKGETHIVHSISAIASIAIAV